MLILNDQRESEVSQQSDNMPEAPERSPEIQQHIDNRYVMEKQTRRVSQSSARFS